MTMTGDKETENLVEMTTSIHGGHLLSQKSSASAMNNQQTTTGRHERHRSWTRNQPTPTGERTPDQGTITPSENITPIKGTTPGEKNRPGGGGGVGMTRYQMTPDRTTPHSRYDTPTQASTPAIRTGGDQILMTTPSRRDSQMTPNGTTPGGTTPGGKARGSGRLTRYRAAVGNAEETPTGVAMNDRDMITPTPKKRRRKKRKTVGNESVQDENATPTPIAPKSNLRHLQEDDATPKATEVGNEGSGHTPGSISMATPQYRLTRNRQTPGGETPDGRTPDHTPTRRKSTRRRETASYTSTKKPPLGQFRTDDAKVSPRHQSSKQKSIKSRKGSKQHHHMMSRKASSKSAVGRFNEDDPSSSFYSDDQFESATAFHEAVKEFNEQQSQRSSARSDALSSRRSQRSSSRLPHISPTKIQQMHNNQQLPHTEMKPSRRTTQGILTRYSDASAGVSANGAATADSVARQIRESDAVKKTTTTPLKKKMKQGDDDLGGLTPNTSTGKQRKAKISEDEQQDLEMLKAFETKTSSFDPAAMDPTAMGGETAGPQKATLFSRMKIPAMFKSVPKHVLNNVVEFKVMQEAIPKKIKKGIAVADKTFGEYLQVNKGTKPYDFGAGYYFTEPKESRGNDLVKAGKDPFLKQAILSRQQAANDTSRNQSTNEVENAQETQANTILNTTKFSNINAVTNRSSGGGAGGEATTMMQTMASQFPTQNQTTMSAAKGNYQEEDSIDEEEMEKLKQARQKQNVGQRLLIESHQTMIDITKVIPVDKPINLKIQRAQENEQKAAIYRTQIVEMRLKEERDRKIYYLNRKKYAMQNSKNNSTAEKPPLPPQTPAGPVSSKKQLLSRQADDSQGNGSIMEMGSESEVTQSGDGRDHLRSILGSGSIPGLRTFLGKNQDSSLRKINQSSLSISHEQLSGGGAATLSAAAISESFSTIGSVSGEPKSLEHPQDRVTPSNNLPSLFIDQTGAEAMSRQKIQLKKSTMLPSTGGTQSNGAPMLSRQGTNFTSLPNLNMSRSTEGLLRNDQTAMGGQRGGRSQSPSKDHQAHKVYHDPRVILIKPSVDASDKELHKRNNMLNAEKNLRKYLEEEGKAAPLKAFVPSRLGQLSKNDAGVKMNVIDTQTDDVNFKEEVTAKNVNSLLKKLEKLQDKDMKKAAASIKDQDTVINKKALKDQLGLGGQKQGEKWAVIKPKIVASGVGGGTIGPDIGANMSAISRTFDGGDISTAHGGSSRMGQSTSASALGNDFSALGLFIEKADDTTNLSPRSATASVEREEDKLLRQQNEREDAIDLKNHKPVFVNKRWQRDTDMRQKIRYLAETGEKMVQKDRSRDYKEEFSETDSAYSQIYDEDSDEEWNQLKREATKLQLQKSNKQEVPALNRIEQRMLEIDKDRARREVLFDEGDPFSHVSAYDGPQNDELKKRQLRQLKLAEEQLNMMGRHVKEDEVKKGIVQSRAFSRPEPNKNLTITNSEGKKVSVYRYIDKDKVMIELDGQKKHDQLFKAEIKANKNRRLLDDKAAVGQGLSSSSKKVKVAEAGTKKVNSEVEKLLIEKWLVQKAKPVLIEKKEAALTIPKQAMVDQMLMDNKNYMKSMALKKRLWVGEEGNFANKDLAEWFKIYNQTQLNKAQKYLKEVKMSNEEKLGIGKHLVKFKLDGTEAQDKAFEDSPRFGGGDKINDLVKDN